MLDVQQILRLTTLNLYGVDKKMKLKFILITIVSLGILSSTIYASGRNFINLNSNEIQVQNNGPLAFTVQAR